MVNTWTWWLIAATITATALVFLVAAAALGRRTRTVAPGALLIPVAALWLWSFGLTAPRYSDIVGVIFPEVGKIRVAPRSAAVEAARSALVQNAMRATPASGLFWQGACLLAVLAMLTIAAPRLAGYLAAASLIAFGGYQVAAICVLTPEVSGTHWYDWLYGMTSRGAVCAVALGSVTAGAVLARYTIIADLLDRGTLATRVAVLTKTRTDATDAAAELRRLERDLHDGAQARLVAIGLSLRALEKLIPDSPAAATALAAECREASAQALADLRDLVRGIYPPVLAERGLGDAVRALAMESPVPVTVEIDLQGRVPAPVESAVYFAVAEALSNVAKHADASGALVSVRHAGGLLRAEVTDDGTGGADPGSGTGLAGIERRLAAFDGILAVHSPAGGPTIVVIEVPCALSSQKISTC